MNDSLFARLGFDPVRIYTHLHGHPPAPGGIARLGSPPAAEEAPDQPGTPEDPPTPEEVAAAPAADGGGAGPGDPSAPDAPSPSAWPKQPAAAPEESEADEDLSYQPPEPAADMHDWLVHNWDAIKALEAAGQLPELAAPALETVNEPDPEPAEPEPELPAKPYVARGDRWTRWKMAEFLRQLAATHSVSAAAQTVGMNRRSAYRLRARLKGQPFDIAWEAAFRHGYDDLAHAALELALEGEEVPHYHQGELKGTHRKRSPHLMLGLLRLRNRAGAPMLGRYGAAAEFWSENWDRMVHRVETGSVTWDDERSALGPRELAKLELPDEKEQIDRIIVRNMPDEGPKGRSR